MVDCDNDRFLSFEFSDLIKEEKMKFSYLDSFAHNSRKKVSIIFYFFLPVANGLFYFD